MRYSPAKARPRGDRDDPGDRAVPDCGAPLGARNDDAQSA
jgi:hypothetical protein